MRSGYPQKSLIATILSRDGTKITKRFGMVLDDLLKFKNWVIENQCEQIAVESTGTYWIPIHSVLEGSVDLIVANAYKIKHTPEERQMSSILNGLRNFVSTV
jgi:transposase